MALKPDDVSFSIFPYVTLAWLGHGIPESYTSLG